MARKAKFSFNDITMSAEIIKVNREKIYGWSEVEVYDKHSSKCELARLVDGQYIIPSGYSSLVTLNDKGDAISKNELIGFDNSGNKVDLVPSIYDQEILLEESSIDEYLLLSVKSVYQLNIEEDKLNVIKKLNGKVFYFVFNYRADFEGDDAFLITNENEIFIVSGKLTEFEFIGLEEGDKLLLSDDSSAGEDDEINFAMF